MRTIRFLLFLLLSFTMTCAWADMLPRPWGGGPIRPFTPPPPPPPPGDNQPKPTAPGSQTSEKPPAAVPEIGVSLAAANVQVRIKKMAAATEGGKKISGLLAQVKGEFDLDCSAAPKEGKDLEVLFPISYEAEKPPAPVRFAVAIDGKPAADIKTDTWSVTDENNKPLTQWGYAWRLTGLTGGQKRRVAVQYSIVLPENQGKAQFLYFLRSGAHWDGPIGQEVVNVTADKGLRMEVLSPAAFKPEKRSDTSLTWKITNAKPAEDIRLAIASAAQP